MILTVGIMKQSQEDLVSCDEAMVFVYRAIFSQNIEGLPYQVD